MRCLLLLPFLFVLNAYAKQVITVSGISSGAFMANQLHVAYSSIFSGVGLIAGGPYGCAAAHPFSFLETCMEARFGGPSGKLLYNAAKLSSQLGLIDDIENLKDHRVFILAGKNDRTVAPEVTLANQDFYSFHSADQMLVVDHLEVGHAYPTKDYGNDCLNESATPWISACDYDTAGVMLSHLYGKLKKAKKPKKSSLFRYKQKSHISMDEYGFAYVPKSCQIDKKCHVHVALHGCGQSFTSIGDTLIQNTGLNNWAEANSIIVLYPQTIPSKVQGNPYGCWDWWGYTGFGHLTRVAPQMKSIVHSLEKLLTNQLVLESF